MALVAACCLLAAGCDFRSTPVPGAGQIRYRDAIFSDVTTTAGVTFARVVTQAKSDAQGAVRYFRANAAAYGIDPNRIAIDGSSAGAITAINVAYGSDDVGTSGHPAKWSKVPARAVGEQAEIYTWPGTEHVPYYSHKTQTFTEMTSFLWYSMDLVHAPPEDIRGNKSRPSGHWAGERGQRSRSRRDRLRAVAIVPWTYGSGDDKTHGGSPVVAVARCSLRAIGCEPPIPFAVHQIGNGGEGGRPLATNSCGPTGMHLSAGRPCGPSYWRSLGCFRRSNASVRRS